jgi:putative endonuclease
MTAYVHILCNKPHGLPHVGVTTDLPARMTKHRAGTGSAFCRRYGIKRLVLVDEYSDIATAIRREKQIKAW